MLGTPTRNNKSKFTKMKTAYFQSTSRLMANTAIDAKCKYPDYTRMRHSLRVGAAVNFVENSNMIEQVIQNSDWKNTQAGLRFLMAE